MTHNLLKGKRGIIFGALNEHSIAWKVAEKAVAEGATITLSNTPMALRMGELDALAEKLVLSPILEPKSTYDFSIYFDMFLNAKLKKDSYLWNN